MSYVCYIRKPDDVVVMGHAEGGRSVKVYEHNVAIGFVSAVHLWRAFARRSSPLTGVADVVVRDDLSCGREVLLVIRRSDAAASGKDSSVVYHRQQD